MFKKLSESFSTRIKSADSKIEDAQHKTIRVSSLLSDMSHRNVADVLKLMNSSANGLSEEEVEQRYKKYGRNEVAHEKSPAWYAQFFREFYQQLTEEKHD